MSFDSAKKTTKVTRILIQFNSHRLLMISRTSIIRVYFRRGITTYKTSIKAKLIVIYLLMRMWNRILIYNSLLISQRSARRLILLLVFYAAMMIDQTRTYRILHNNHRNTRLISKRINGRMLNPNTLCVIDDRIQNKIKF